MDKNMAIVLIIIKMVLWFKEFISMINYKINELSQVEGFETWYSILD